MLNKCLMYICIHIYIYAYTFIHVHTYMHGHKVTISSIVLLLTPGLLLPFWDFSFSPDYIFFLASGL